MMKNFLYLTVILVFLNNVVASETALNLNKMDKAKGNATSSQITQDEIEAKGVMNKVYESFLKIMPFIYSDKIENIERDKKTESELIANLNDLKAAFKEAKHTNLLKIPGFKPSLETINTHIQDTIDAVSAKNKVFAHARLKAMTTLCISCHSGLSDRISGNAFGEAMASTKREEFPTDFAFANFLYLVRRFPEAKNYYEMAIKNAISNSHSMGKNIVTDDKVINGDIYTSLRRVVSIFTKINIRPSSAIEFLNKYKNDKNISKFTRSDIEVWITALSKWKKFDFSNVKNIDEFIKTNLLPLEDAKAKVFSGEADITLLISAGVLTKYLNDHPDTEQTPNLLYWLAIAERRLSSSYFFSLSDLYLKECITQYSKSVYAKKCYLEFEDNLIFGYSGSSGTDIPEGERKELLRLKALIK
jgi:uncharacterized protein (UPF0147 family)